MINNNLLCIGFIPFILLSSSALAAIEENQVIAKQYIDKLHAMSLEELMNVNVTSSTKSQQKTSSAPNTINAYNAEDLRALGATRLSDLMWTIAGVQVQVNNSRRTELWVRGVQSEFSNKIALFIDGVPFQNVLGGFPSDEELPLDFIKHIEVIRGPGAALYGTGAFSSVINIYTYRPGEKHYNRIKVGAGQDDTKTTYFSGDTQIKDVKLMLEGKWFDSNGKDVLFDRKGNANPPRGAQDAYSIHLKSSALDDQLQLNFMYTRFDNQRNLSGDSPELSDRTQQNLRINLNYDYKWNDDLSMTANVYHTRDDRLEDTSVTDLLKTVKTDDVRFEDNIALSGINSSATYQFNPSNKWVTGVDAQRRQLTDSFFVNNLTGKTSSFVLDPRFKDLALHNVGLFLQNNYTFDSIDTTITSGIRYDVLDLFDNQFSYRIGLVHQFNPKIYGKLLYGTAFRAPSFIEFTRAPLGSALPKVEKVQTAELQLGYHDKTDSYTVSFYRNDYKDFITRKNSFLPITVDLQAEQFGNLDKQLIYGVELETRKYWTERWESFTNVAWLHAKSLVAQETLPLLANWTTSWGINWHERIDQGELLLANSFIYYSDRKDWPGRLWPDGQAQNYANRSGDLNAGFVVWNSGVHYRFTSGSAKGIDLSLTVKNILNTVYYTQSTVVPNPTRPAAFDNQYDPRHVRLSISYDW